MNEVFIILILILLNGVFSMSEIAIISARKTTLANHEKKGSKRARTALRLANDPDRFLSTVQIGITLIGILTGVYSGAALSAKLAALFTAFGLAISVALPLAQALIVILVTYLSIVIGELVPKRVGMSVAEKVSLAVARPMMLLSKMASPFVWLLSKSTEGVVKCLGLGRSESKVTEEDIKSMVQEGREDGEVQEVEQDIVERVFMVGDLKVSQLMTHRSFVATMDVRMTGDDVRQVVGERAFEAYPVTDGGFKRVVGVVYLKDLVLALGRSGFSLAAIMRPPVYLYENTGVYQALEQMKKRRLSQAFVSDEFGDFQGVITLRDILEGLVGTIDEHNAEPDIVERADGGGWYVDGQCPVHEFLAHFDREDLFDAAQGYNTLAGLLIETMGRIPISGEYAVWNGFRLEVSDMDGARIDKVLVTKV